MEVAMTLFLMPLCRQYHCCCHCYCNCCSCRITTSITITKVSTVAVIMVMTTRTTLAVPITLIFSYHFIAIITTNAIVVALQETYYYNKHCPTIMVIVSRTTTIAKATSSGIGNQHARNSVNRKELE